MQFKSLATALPHYTQMVSLWWLAHSWKETTGLIDFFGKLHFGRFGENFLSSTNSGAPEFIRVQCELYHKPLKRSRNLYATIDNSLRSHQPCLLFLPTPVKTYFPLLLFFSLQSFFFVCLFVLFLIFFLFCGGFCQTLKWNSQGFTCVPHPNPPCHLPLQPFPLGFPSAPGPSTCLMHPTWAGDLFHPR